MYNLPCFRSNPGNKLATKKKPPTNNFVSGWLLSGPSWARMLPPDYEFQIGISIRLHRFVCICTSIIYSLLNVKDSMGLHWFVEILAKKLAPNRFMLHQFFWLKLCNLSLNLTNQIFGTGMGSIIMFMRRTKFWLTKNVSTGHKTATFG